MNKYAIGVIVVVLALGAGFLLFARTPSVQEQSSAPVVKEGEHCGGNIKNAPVCEAGYHCELTVNMPDTGGICVKDSEDQGGGAEQDQGIGDASGPEQDTSTETVKLNQSFTALASTVKPTEVTEDSRCPQGVQCIWAGTVKVKAHISTNLGAYDYTFELGKPLEREGERITLTEVTPTSTSGTMIAPADYAFTFEVQSI